MVKVMMCELDLNEAIWKKKKKTGKSKKKKKSGGGRDLARGLWFSGLFRTPSWARAGPLSLPGTQWVSSACSDK